MKIEIVTGEVATKNDGYVSRRRGNYSHGTETGVYVIDEGKEDHPVIIGCQQRDAFLISKDEKDTFTWESLGARRL